jgi:hypothetical protein
MTRMTAKERRDAELEAHRRLLECAEMYARDRRLYLQAVETGKADYIRAQGGCEQLAEQRLLTAARSYARVAPRQRGNG